MCVTCAAPLCHVLRSDRPGAVIGDASVSFQPDGTVSSAGALVACGAPVDRAARGRAEMAMRRGVESVAEPSASRYFCGGGGVCGRHLCCRPHSLVRGRFLGWSLVLSSIWPLDIKSGSSGCPRTQNMVRDRLWTSIGMSSTSRSSYSACCGVTRHVGCRHSGRFLHFASEGEQPEFGMSTIAAHVCRACFPIVPSAHSGETDVPARGWAKSGRGRNTSGRVGFARKSVQANFGAVE